MSDPSLAMQRAIVAALAADSELVAAIGARIYDTPSPAATFPYLTIGDDDVRDDSAEGIDAAEMTVQVNVWSRPSARPGWGECKAIAARVVKVIDQSLPVLDGFAVVSLDYEATNYLRDPDGLTRRAVITFNALVDAEDVVIIGEDLTLMDGATALTAMDGATALVRM